MRVWNGDVVSGVVRNLKSEEKRAFKVSMAQLEKAADSGKDICIGSCRCKVEVDGDCPKGWVSRTQAAGF